MCLYRNVDRDQHFASSGVHLASKVLSSTRVFRHPQGLRLLGRGWGVGESLIPEREADFHTLLTAGAAPGRQHTGPGPHWGGRRAGRAQPPCAMGVIFDVPKYPVIDPAPGMWRTMQNYGLKEYAIIAGIPLGIAPFAYNWGAAQTLAGHA